MYQVRACKTSRRLYVVKPSVICLTSCVVFWCSSRERSLSSSRFGSDMVCSLIYLVESGWGLKVTFNCFAIKVEFEISISIKCSQLSLP